MKKSRLILSINLLLTIFFFRSNIVLSSDNYSFIPSIDYDAECINYLRQIFLNIINDHENQKRANDLLMFMDKYGEGIIIKFVREEIENMIGKDTTNRICLDDTLTVLDLAVLKCDEELAYKLLIGSIEPTNITKRIALFTSNINLVDRFFIEYGMCFDINDGQDFILQKLFNIDNFDSLIEHDDVLCLLHYACKVGDVDKVKILLGKDSDVKRFNINGELPLVLACGDCQKGINYENCEKDRLKIVKCLVERDAEINSKDLFGRTALYEAISKGYLKIVKYLLSKGANVDVRDVSR